MYVLAPACLRRAHCNAVRRQLGSTSPLRQSNSPAGWCPTAVFNKAMQRRCRSRRQALTRCYAAMASCTSRNPPRQCARCCAWSALVGESHSAFGTHPASDSPWSMRQFVPEAVWKWHCHTDPIFSSLDRRSECRRHWSRPASPTLPRIPSNRTGMLPTRIVTLNPYLPARSAPAPYLPLNRALRQMACALTSGII